LTKDLPEGLLAVQQFEAASKFFRSHFVVLATLALFYARHDKFLEAGLCFAGMLPTYGATSISASRQRNRHIGLSSRLKRRRQKLRPARRAATD
jgi:hypothetical protein